MSRPPLREKKITPSLTSLMLDLKHWHILNLINDDDYFPDKSDGKTFLSLFFELSKEYMNVRFIKSLMNEVMLIYRRYDFEIFVRSYYFQRTLEQLCIMKKESELPNIPTHNIYF